VNTLRALTMMTFASMASFLYSLDTPIVDTGQTEVYGDMAEISWPREGSAFYGQDAQYEGNKASYRDNGDGTVTDLVTGLMWSKAVGSDKVTPGEAASQAKGLTLAGYDDWRVPNIKELYSLIDFRGNTGFYRSSVSPEASYTEVPGDAVPYINTDYFDFMYGYTEGGERYIDAQWLSSTEYVSTTMNNMDTVFGVNFADGRIKGYGYRPHGSSKDIKTFYVRFVRGAAYGKNDFHANGDGTVTDRNTGLMWAQTDSGRGMTWEDALSYAEKSEYAGYSDWRLPNAKELQYLVDYHRSPDTTDSPAIDPLFKTSEITNEAGQRDFPYFWTSTTHLDGPVPAAGAVYVAFGRAIGQLGGTVMDVHGAGAQRSDPKKGSPVIGKGPQGDSRRVLDYVRLVRGGVAKKLSEADGGRGDSRYPEKIRVSQPQPTKPVLLGPESRSLSQGVMGPNVGEPGFVARLDKDHDGRVSRAEFDGPPDAFDRLDKNHDGYLTEDEAPKEAPPRNGW